MTCAGVFIRALFGFWTPKTKRTAQMPSDVSDRVKGTCGHFWLLLFVWSHGSQKDGPQLLGFILCHVETP